MTRDAFSGVVPDRRGSDRVFWESLEHWWAFEKDERAHMELRRWLQARYEEGWPFFAVEPILEGDIDVEGHPHQAVVRGEGERVQKRPLSWSEHGWLQRAWPEELWVAGSQAGMLVPE